MERLRRAAHALRPPPPLATRPAPVRVARQTQVLLAIAPQPIDAVEATMRHWRPPPPVMIVPGSTELIDATDASVAVAVAAHVQSSGDVRIGVPAVLEAVSARRWKEVASRIGCEHSVLGDDGWDRVTFEGLPTHLTHVDLPAALGTVSTAILLVPLASVISPLHAWRIIVSRNTMIRAAPLGDSGDVDLSAAIDATYLLHGVSRNGWLAAITDDRVAAELIAQAIVRTAEIDRGIEATGPWEDVRVQRAVELGLGVSLPGDLVVHASVPDNARAEVERIVELIGCRVEYNVFGGIDA